MTTLLRVTALACSILLGAGALPAQKMAERNPEYLIHRSDVLDVKFVTRQSTTRRLRCGQTAGFR